MKSPSILRHLPTVAVRSCARPANPSPPPRPGRSVPSFATKLPAVLALGLTATLLFPAAADAAKPGRNIWSHDNIIAWCVAPPWDANNRSSDERALMLKRLGLHLYTHNWRNSAIPGFDGEIEAMQRHGIEFAGWWLNDSDNPALPKILAAIARRGIHPRIWLRQESPVAPKTPEDWDRLMPPGVRWPRNAAESKRLSAVERDAVKEARRKAREMDFTRTAAEQERRVELEAERIVKLVEKLASLGCPVDLYNHNGWFGLIENQIAIIERLKTRGITDVGIVYNFSHARDEFHDDSKSFRELWTKMRPYVVAVNITGMCMDESDRLYPSQGDAELEMMRIIQDSGWTGHIGLIAEKGGDAEITMRNYLKGLDWLAAELNQPGSGGPKPFPEVPPSP